MHLIARFLDDVKRSTPQLVRALVFLWLLVILVGVVGMGTLLLLSWAAHALPVDGSWLLSWILEVGALGTVSIGIWALRRARRTHPPDQARAERPPVTTADPTDPGDGP
jgi:hypothetical protein